MRSERIHEVNGKAETQGEYVLYWMQSSLRGRENLALDWAVAAANERGLPLRTVFCVVEDFPGASPSHYRYLLGGVRAAAEELADKGVALTVARGRVERVIPAFAQGAALVVADCGVLRVQRSWLAQVAELLPCRLVRLEGNTVLPLEAVSDKEEWSAFTLRRRMTPLIDGYLEEPEERVPRRPSLGLDLPRAWVPHLAELDRLEAVPPGTPPSRWEEQTIRELPGHQEARRIFEDFLDRRLEGYEEDRNDPTKDGSSRLSAALHFGHVSPVELVRTLLRRIGAKSVAACQHRSAAAFLEELVVRRELAWNFVAHREDYDRYTSIPDWAARTLAEGALDRRDAVYSAEDFEYSRTHDPYWNAAQDQMVLTGRMHGYMRMYWGKQILAWSRSPEEAYRTAVALNDAYSLDGRDPNGYAGVAWCFGKHDRPWTGRPVFGSVRCMNAKGLKRKFDADAYVRAVRALKEAPCSII